MEQTIWKYELTITDCQNISMPEGAEILTVQNQNGIPCLLVLVNPKNKTKLRTFEIFGTGHPILSDMGTSRKYISTFQMKNGNIVFHVFEYTGI